MLRQEVAGPGTGPTTVAALPEALAAQILQHVPQRQRLTQCALACKAWASAAVLATSCVEYTVQPGASMAAFEGWLERHAAGLESLTVSASRSFRATDHELQLPLTKLGKLQLLDIHGASLRLPGEGDGSNRSSSSPGAGAAAATSSSRSSSGGDGNAPVASPPSLPSLQHLRLSGVQLLSTSSLLQLTHAPQLQTLEMCTVSFVQPIFHSGLPDHNSPAAVQQVAEMLPRLLQQLPRLMTLELPGLPLSDTAVQELGAMQQLREVWLEPVPHMPACDLQALPSSVTQLCWGGPGSHSPPPQLQQLAGLPYGLLQLHLEECDVLPTVLGGLTRLQRLHMEHCTLLPAGALGEFETAGTAALLDALQQMGQLQDLQLSLEGLDTVSIAPQHFAALTASSHLTRLVLDPDNCMPLPQGAVEHMFPAGRQLPLLQRLCVCPADVEEWDEWDGWCMDGADIARIASCCTALQGLGISLVVQPGADLSSLLQLPGSCTALRVGGEAITDAAAPLLVQLTQLADLSICKTFGFTDVGLEQLTGLQALKNLDVFDCGLSDVYDKDGGVIMLKSHSHLGTVSEQLNDLCDLSPVLAPARLQRLREAAAVKLDLQAELGVVRAQLAVSRTQNEQLQQEIEQLRQQNQQLQQQLEASGANSSG